MMAELKVAVAASGSIEECNAAIQEFLSALPKDWVVCGFDEQRKPEGDQETGLSTVVFTLRCLKSFEINQLFKLLRRDLNVTRRQMSNGNDRQRNVSAARSIATFILRYRYGFSLERIAKTINVKTHATCLYALKRFRKNGMQKSFYRSVSLEEAYVDAKGRYGQWGCLAKSGKTKNGENKS